MKRNDKATDARLVSLLDQLDAEDDRFMRILSRLQRVFNLLAKSKRRCKRLGKRIAAREQELLGGDPNAPK